MDRNDQKQYWKMVRRQAWTVAWEKAGMKVLIPVLLIILSSNALTGILLVFRWVSYPFFRDNILANSITGLSQVILSALGLFILFGWLLYDTPPRIHKEQSQRIEFLEQQTSPISVQFELSSSRPKENPQGDSLVEIRIINKSNIHVIEKCKVELSEVLDLVPDQIPHYFSDHRVSLPADLEWNSIEHPDTDGCITLFCGGEATINIARSKEQYHAGYFNVVNGGDLYYFQAGQFKMIFRIDGFVRTIVNGTECLKAIEPQKFSAIIEMRPTVDLTIRDITWLNPYNE